MKIIIAGIYVQFSQSQYVVDESDGRVTLKLTINGDYYRKFIITVYLKVFLSSRFQAKAGIYVNIIIIYDYIIIYLA